MNSWIGPKTLPYNRSGKICFITFSFSGLTREQVHALRDRHSIYIVDSGRINVAGMTPGNMDTLCQAIAEVLQAVRR